MPVRLDEAVLAGHAYQRLRHPERLAPSLWPLYDPGAPLPTKPPSRPELPLVFGAIADPYSRHLEQAYVQMTAFADAWWLPVSGMVDAEPLFEWLMHTDLFNRHYRDHIVHQVRVAAIGDLLLDQKVAGRTLLGRATEALSRRSAADSPSAESVLLAWWLAAMFHDCGYPHQLLHGHTGALRTAFRMTVGSPSAAHWSACYQELARLTGGLTALDVANCLRGRHPFTGAAALASQERRYESRAGRKEDPTYRDRRRAVLGLAARAILLHHQLRKSKDWQPIRFKDEPLAFLLVLSDEIHEFDRPAGIPYAAPTPAGTNQTVIGYDFGPVEGVEVRSTGGSGGKDATLRLTFQCQDGTRRLRGKSLADWQKAKQEDKQEDLERALCFADGELFRKPKVMVV